MGPNFGLCSNEIYLQRQYAVVDLSNKASSKLGCSSALSAVNVDLWYVNSYTRKGHCGCILHYLEV